MADASFKVAIKFYQPLAKLTHTQQVQRLYRKCLRNLSSWVESRDVWCEEAIKIRAEFDANKAIPADSARTARLLREAGERLAKQTHPDPYIAAYMPGGSLFMRNPAIPLEALYPDGIPEGVSRRRMNIDMSNIPDDQPWADKVLVDSTSKTYTIEK